MKVVLNFMDNKCVVTKEPDDKKYSRSGYTPAESTFLYHVKKELLEQGFDVIKKRMWKDGHMVDDTQQYIRTHNTKQNEYFCVFNNYYAIFDAGERFNEMGVGDTIELLIVRE